MLSRAYISAKAQAELDKNKQQGTANILKMDDPPNFQTQVANGPLEKPMSTATLICDIRDNTFAEYFVIMKYFTGPNIGLHFKRRNSVVIDTPHGLIQFPHLTMEAKNSATGTSAKPQPVFIQDNRTEPPMTTKTITEFADHPSEQYTTDTVTPVEKITEAVSLLISH